VPLSQLALPLQLQDHAVFESFWPAGNDALVSYLNELVATSNGPGCWIWGAAATGKTHLLQAVCEKQGDRAAYVPLALLADAGPGILEGLSSRQFVCLDDVHLVAADADWELALFNLYNLVADAKGIMIAAAIAAPRECHFGLADLASRFSLLPAFHLTTLAEADRIKALQLRARHPGSARRHGQFPVESQQAGYGFLVCPTGSARYGRARSQTSANDSLRERDSWQRLKKSLFPGLESPAGAGSYPAPVLRSHRIASNKVRELRSGRD
jgi:DnaA family protein